MTLREIQQFCRLTGLSETAFGRLALNDKALVHGMKYRNRELRKATAERVREFMEHYQPEGKK